MQAPRFVEQAPWESGFAAVFEREILPGLQPLESARVQALALFRKLLIGVLILAAVAWVILFSSGANWFVLAVLVPVAAAALGFAAFFYARRGYHEGLREAVMPPLCRFLGDLVYSREGKDGGIRPERLVEAGLLPPARRFKTEDYFAGRWRDTPWEMVELRLFRESRDSKGRRSEKTVYRGLVLRIEVPIAFTGLVVVSRDYGSLGNELRKLLNLGARLTPVPVPHPQFEKAFEVFTDGQADVPSLLTGPVLEALLQLDQAQGSKGLTGAFVDGAFFVALPVSRDLFEFGSLFRSVYRVADDLHELLFQATVARRIIDALHGEAAARII